MSTPNTITDIVIITNKLKNGVNIHKCMMDGKTVQIQNGKIQSEESYFAISIVCTVEDGQQTTIIKAHHPLDGGGDTIEVAGVEGKEVDIDVRIIPHLTCTNVKATLQFQQNDSLHTIEMCGKIAGA